jgi:hypothetical protein
MPLIPEDDPEPQPVGERVVRAIVDPIERIPPVLAALVVAAGAGSTAPDPFGVIAAAVLIPAAWYVARRK